MGATSWCKGPIMQRSAGGDNTCLFLFHSKRHLEAFLYIKANLSRSELKSILGYLADSTASQLPKAPLFSDISVS